MHTLSLNLHTVPNPKGYSKPSWVPKIFCQQRWPKAELRSNNVRAGRNQKTCFHGGKDINFNRPEMGAFFFSPPKYLVPRRLIANSQYLRHFAAFCSVFRCFPAFPPFSGIFRQTGDDCEHVCGILRRFAAFCSVLRRFAAFCSVLRCFAARWQ